MTTPPIVIRAICPEDKQALRDGTDRLSERSRYRRFLSPHGSLTSAELTYFTEVDHHDHEALVAIDPTTGEGIGVARYIRSPVRPDVAELAVAVADDWQQHGVGTRLTEALACRARHEGITRFTALLFADNTPMLHLIKSLGVVHDMSVHQGIVELTVDLPPHGVGGIAQLLHGTASDTQSGSSWDQFLENGIENHATAAPRWDPAAAATSVRS
jgi:RimJ/RimL family protein N-acetyltransferase